MQFLKKLCLVVWALSMLQSANAFSLLGPKEEYQILALGFSGDFSDAPKNLGEEYRWNLRTVYYTYDANFLDYFGSNGVHAVDSAVAILNGLTNVSDYSADLSEFPLEEMRLNYTANALHLMDLKSCALEVLVERLGLADPEAFTWNLRNAVLPPGAQCPALIYTVIMRNFDPVTLSPSPYVNGNLFTYLILQGCNPQVAIALEQKVYDTDVEGTAVATGKIMFNNSAYWGWFHTGLTRDDIGGLRYLYRTNNLNVEAAAPNTQTFITNVNSELLFTSNLTLLVHQSLTNNAAQLQALYPNLIIGSTTPIFTNVVSTNIFFFFTNYPWAPAGTVSLAFQTNLTTNVVTWFSHTFDNVVTNTYYTNGFMTVLETSVGPRPYGSPGQLYTNVTARTIYTNFISGDYYILPTNASCGFLILSTQLTSVLNFTNTPVAATNAAGATNINGVSFAQEIVFPFTNYVYVVKPISCALDTNSVALRQGVEKITFVRRDFDSLLNRTWYPVTNTFTINAVTNNTLYPQTVRRVVTAPDILFSAADIVTPPESFPIIVPTVSRQVPNWVQATAGNGLIGPGTIDPTVVFTFNKVGPIRENSNPFFSDEQLGTFIFNWGSFDGTTNYPVVYPNSEAIYALENMILLQVSPSLLATGKVNEVYNQPLTVLGGQAPYTWELQPGSPLLPPGLSLTSDGTIVGTPQVAGSTDIIIRLTDANSRFVDRPYKLTIVP